MESWNRSGLQSYPKSCQWQISLTFFLPVAQSQAIYEKKNCKLPGSCIISRIVSWDSTAMPNSSIRPEKMSIDREPRIELHIPSEESEKLLFQLWCRELWGQYLSGGWPCNILIFQIRWNINQVYAFLFSVANNARTLSFNWALLPGIAARALGDPFISSYVSAFQDTNSEKTEHMFYFLFLLLRIILSVCWQN